MTVHRLVIAILVITVCTTGSFAGVCPYCGTENPDVATFCKNCGRRLPEPKPPESRTLEQTISQLRESADDAFEAEKWELALEIYQQVLRAQPTDSAAAQRIPQCITNMKTVRLPMGRARIMTDPTGADVMIDGTHLGTAPLKDLELPTGICDVLLTKRLHEDWIGTLEIVDGGTSILDIDLREKTRGKAFMRSLILPGQGQRYRERPLPGWFYTLSTVGAICATGYLYNEYDDAYGRYESARETYDTAISGHDVLWSEVARTHDIAESKQSDFYLGVAVAAGLYLINLVDSLVF